MIRRENVLRQELWEAHYYGQVNRRWRVTNHSTCFEEDRPRPSKIEEDRWKEAQQLSFESMAQSQRKRPPPRPESYTQHKRPRVDTYVQPAQEQSRRGRYGRRGGSGGRGSRGVSGGRSGTGNTRRGSFSTQPSRVVKKRF